MCLRPARPWYLTLRVTRSSANILPGFSEREANNSAAGDSPSSVLASCLSMSSNGTSNNSSCLGSPPGNSNVNAGFSRLPARVR